MSSGSSRFTAIYNSLPRDAQQSLVHQQLIPLLESAQRRKSKKALGTAARLRKRHAGIPQLDLRSKKQEINNMLKELLKDTKRSYVVDSSNRAEILEEIVGSLAMWMNDVWTVVYEHNVDFAQAHDCLLFVSATLERIDSIRMGCKCALNTMYVPVTLRNRKGKIIKKFEINGASRLEDATLFIWRDMLLCMLAYGSQQHRNMVPRMLNEMENAMGWNALVRMMYTKPKGSRRQSLVDNESDWEDVPVEDEDDLPDLAEISDSDESEYNEGEGKLPDFGLPSMRHWSASIVKHLPRLRQHVETTLLTVFETNPSPALCDTLLRMSYRVLRPQLIELMKTIATTSSDVYSVALEVCSEERELGAVLGLLDSHSHLLRPRDAEALQTAAKFLSRYGHAPRAVCILEAELLDTARAIRHALLQSFSQLESSANRTELTQIIKMRSGAPGRRDRVEAWVDAAATPGANQPNPMLLAAMVMGIGPMPGLNADDDPYTYLDLDPSDPDLADLRSEYRPDFKKRFEGWADIGLVLKGGPASLLGVYRKIVEILPFLRASDITEEMISRLQDRASKQFICDGLDALLAFVKVQRRKWNTLRQEQKRMEARAAESTAASSSKSSRQNAASSSSISPPPSSPFSISSTLYEPSSSGEPSSKFTSRSASPGPPPLIPAMPHHLQGAGQPNAPNYAEDASLTVPTDLMSEIDTILASAPPPVGPTPTSILNFLMGMGPPPTQGGPAAPTNPGGGSSVDDVD